MLSDADLLDRLSTNWWFGSLPHEERQAVLARCEPVEIDTQQMLCHRGDPATSGFYGVVSGRLKASTVRGDGKEAILSLIEPGTWFGQMSMITGLPRDHDITALEPSSVLVINADGFESLMQRNAFARAIALLQSMHTHWLYLALEDATLHSTRARIARRLATLAHGGMGATQIDRREIPVSQEALAMMLGVSRQTLALELKAMEQKGAVALRYGHIEIVSHDILRTFESYA